MTATTYFKYSDVLRRLREGRLGVHIDVYAARLFSEGRSYQSGARCNQADVGQKPNLLSDNGPSYISGDLADWLSDNGMSHVRGAPYHPQMQGKIYRWHQALKNRILLENYFLPGDLEKQIELFVDHYNHQRYHESLENLTPADIYFGRGQSIRAKRARIKKRTIAKRRLHYQRHAA